MINDVVDSGLHSPAWIQGNLLTSTSTAKIRFELFLASTMACLKPSEAFGPEVDVVGKLRALMIVCVIDEVYDILFNWHCFGCIMMHQVEVLTWWMFTSFVVSLAHTHTRDATHLQQNACMHNHAYYVLIFKNDPLQSTKVKQEAVSKCFSKN